MVPRLPTTFVATLGGQPQVVTFALDMLLANDTLIDEVMVIHLGVGTARLRAAADQLDGEFQRGRYGDHPCRYRRETALMGGRPVLDVTSDTEAQAVLNTLRMTIQELKSRQRSIHLSIAGGRRSMGILAMAVAPLHFDHTDSLWHLYTPEPFRTESREGALMHVPPGLLPDARPRLIRIPVMPWGEYFPSMRALTSIDPPQVISPLQQSADERQRCQAVLETLTPRQQAVLRALALGQSPDEVGVQLHLTRATVDSHKTAIYRACREQWPDESGRLNYRFLTLKFSPFFASLSSQKS